MPDVIKANKLTLSYEEEKYVIKDATFSIKKGDFVFITGPSGSGKSTLLKAFYGNLQPKGGSLVVGGLDMIDIKKTKLQELRTHLGIIFQDYKLINEWTVEKM